MKPTYSMSEAGGCSRAIAAPRLEYDAPPRSTESLRVMREGQRHEVLVAEDLAEMGYEVLDAPGECDQGCDREGYHVEIDLPALKLVGHIDRRVVIEGKEYPVEIKSMGRFVFPKWEKERFAAFPGYAAQMACYMEADQAPGIYVVKNRDTGELVLSVVPFYGEIVPLVRGLPNLDPIQLGVSFESISQKLQWIELCVQDGELPKCDAPEGDFKWCKFPFLCRKPAELPVSEVSRKDLEAAAEKYEDAHTREMVAGDDKKAAREILLMHARAVSKFQVRGLSVAYSNEKRTVTVNQEKLRASILNVIGENQMMKVVEASTDVTTLRTVDQDLLQAMFLDLVGEKDMADAVKGAEEESVSSRVLRVTVAKKK